MAIKGSILKFSDAPSIDQRWKESTGAAEKIQNFRIDPSGDGWLADRGLEPWYDYGGDTVLGPDTTPYWDKKVDSQFIWTKQSTGQTYHFVEQEGTLYYLWGNKGNPTISNYWRDAVIIATGRRTRKVGDPGTQYVPYGDRLLILNGYDKPIWFYGDNRFRDFGFLLPSPSPDVIDVNVTYATTSDLTDGIPRPTFGNSRPIGLGDTGNSDENRFSYRMSFVSDTGSESPLGAPSFVSWTNTATYNAKRGVFLIDVPTGKQGIVARRIYRTRNLRSSTSDVEQNYYLVRQIDDNSCTSFIDVIPDSSLVTPGPAITDSEKISTTYQFGESWNNRLWLGGGPDHPTRIIYSEAGFPEQFGTFNYFDVGSSSGGHITGLYSFYNSLLVLREKAIDIIRQGPQGLTISQLTPDVGTTASNTICLVPGVGVVFLNKDGLYAATGGLEGGSVVSVVKISDTIGKAIQSINIPALPNCTAAYSKKEKEYWLHYVRKGETVPTRGIVIHTYNKSFSFRGANNKDDEYLWSFTTIQTDPDGNFILGTRPDWRLANGTPSNPTTTSAIGSLVGLQVWSGANYWGKTLTAGPDLGQGNRLYTGAVGPLQENIWESNWMNFGDAADKHRVFSVEMEMVSYGDNLVYLDWGYDYDITWNPAGGQKVSKPEVIFTANEDPVFGPADATVTKSTFQIGQDQLRSGRIVVIRWDVNTKLVENFRFRVRQPDGKPFHVLGFNINYNTSDQAPLNQRTRLQRGQPY
jgi:hypothetical protein